MQWVFYPWSDTCELVQAVNSSCTATYTRDILHSTDHLTNTPSLLSGLFKLHEFPFSPSGSSMLLLPRTSIAAYSFNAFLDHRFCYNCWCDCYFTSWLCRSPCLSPSPTWGVSLHPRRKKSGSLPQPRLSLPRFTPGKKSDAPRLHRHSRTTRKRLVRPIRFDLWHGSCCPASCRRHTPQDSGNCSSSSNNGLSVPAPAAAIPDSLRNQILTGQDVNLVKILLCASEPADKRFVDCGNFTVVLKDSDPRLSKTLTMAEFNVAFSVFRDTICEMYPQRQ